MGNVRSIRASANDEGIELYIMSEISSWTAQDCFGAFVGFGTDKHYILNINSPGGDPFAAFAIHDFIKAKGIKVTARVYGHAASAAAIIACACDRVEMGELSHMMIHNAYGGNDAGLLDSLNAKQVEVFTAKTGKGKAAITKLMDAETWMDAKTAKAEGFIDSVIKELAIAATYKASYMESTETKVEETKTEEVKVEETTPETPEAETEEVETKVEVTPAEAVIAGVRGYIKVKGSVNKDIQSKLAEAIAEVKEVKAKADEAISEAEGLKEKQAKAEQDVKAANEEAAKAKAEVEALQAKVTEITAEVEKLKKAPLANADGEPKGGAGVQTPGAGTGSTKPAVEVNERREAVNAKVTEVLDRVKQRGTKAA